MTCDCCQTDRPCVRLYETSYAGDTYACHKCCGWADEDCDECPLVLNADEVANG